MVKTKNDPQSPFSQSTNAPEDEASSSGALVDWLNGDWGSFFVLTTIMVIPSLICLWLIKNKIKFGAK